MKTSKRLFLLGLIALTLAGLRWRALASSIIPLSPSEHINASAAVFRGTVLSLESFRDHDGLIYTRAAIRVDEPLLGKFPDALQVVHRGGRVGSEDEYSGLSPRFIVGGEYLVFVSRRKDGRLHCTQGCASAIPLSHISSGVPGEMTLLRPAKNYWLKFASWSTKPKPRERRNRSGRFFHDLVCNHRHVGKRKHPLSSA
ncbi:MAG: hypothetical protein U1F83_15060 [Verrucomicrobiota bacterium]